MSKKDNVTVTHGTDAVAPAVHAPAVHAPVPVPQRAIPQQPTVNRLQGAQVNPGEDWRHLTHDERLHWFASLEHRWKQQYNSRQQGGQPVSMGWTRG